MQLNEQHNGQKKRANINLQNTTQITIDQATQTSLQTGDELRLEETGVPGEIHRHAASH
jgi:hypothetical protein